MNHVLILDVGTPVGRGKEIEWRFIGAERRGETVAVAFITVYNMAGKGTRLFVTKNRIDFTNFLWKGESFMHGRDQLNHSTLEFLLHRVTRRIVLRNGTTHSLFHFQARKQHVWCQIELVSKKESKSASLQAIDHVNQQTCRQKASNQTSKQITLNLKNFNLTVKWITRTTTPCALQLIPNSHNRRDGESSSANKHSASYNCNLLFLGLRTKRLHSIVLISWK